MNFPSALVVDLTESTIEANARFFASMDDVPKAGNFHGHWHYYESEKIILMANGKGKSLSFMTIVFGPRLPRFPLSILRFHPDVMIFIDEEAYSEIGKNAQTLSPRFLTLSTEKACVCLGDAGFLLTIERKRPGSSWGALLRMSRSPVSRAVPPLGMMTWFPRRMTAIIRWLGKARPGYFGRPKGVVFPHLLFGERALCRPPDGAPPRTRTS